MFSECLIGKFYIVFILLCLPGNVIGAEKVATVAAKIPVAGRGYVELKVPPELPCIELESQVSDDNVAIPEYHIMRTEKEFCDELAKLRKQYAPLA